MGRFYLIGLVVFLGIVYIGIGFGFYYYMKKKVVHGRRLIDHSVNEQTRTDKMEIGEYVTYGSMIVVAILAIIPILSKGGSGNAILARLIILPPIMALFNARKRTGRSMLVLIIAFLFFMFGMMAYLIIGIPKKAPTLKINDTKLIVTKTTVGDMMKDGFDIYIRQENHISSKYSEILSSGEYEKYSANRSVLIKKEFKQHSYPVARSPYLLVKNGVVIGGIEVYGDKNKEVALEDCKITYFVLDQDNLPEVRKNSISYQFEGVDLFSKLTLETVRKAFGKKLWLFPSNPTSKTDLCYGIQWSTRSDLIWNEYYSYIRFDEQNDITSFELSSKIPKDN